MQNLLSENLVHRAILNDRIVSVTAKYHGYTATLYEDGKEVGTVEDYDPRLDCHYHMSDDGSEYYYTMALIGPEVVDIPEASKCEENFLKHSLKFMETVIRGQTHMDDVHFFRHTLTKPAMFYKFWKQANGDYDKAATKIMKEVFLIG